MAIREKTLIFACPMASALVADATVTNLDQITVHIPEADPVFTSVFVEVGIQDVITATGGTITEHRVGLRLGAAAYSTVTELDDITNSGENMAGVIGPFDFTAHFAANWTGTSMTCDVQVYFDQTTGTTLGQANVTALVHVTYEYDDAATTQIKTVLVPLESLTGALPTAQVGYGTNQIPQLTGAGGLLPEASPVIRDWFLLIEGNETNNNAATDFALSIAVDGGAATVFTGQECALASDRFCRWVWRPAAPDPGAAHDLELWSSVENKCAALTVTLVVTYEFNAATTTRVLNSIQLPIEIDSPMGRTGAGQASRFARELIVSEPGVITLRQSAARLNWNASANVATLRLRAGDQAYRAYTTLGNVVCGMFAVQQRIDAGGEQGAGITLARGACQIAIDCYSSHSSQEATNINGLILLNYESDKAAAGIGAHAHTVRKVLLPWDAALTDLVTVNSAFGIPGADYWVMSAGFCFIQWTGASSQAVTLDVQCQPGESKGAGYNGIYADAYVCDSERACSIIWMRGRDVFKRCPQDADADRLDIEVARDYRLFTTTTCSNGIVAAVTVHGHTWSKSVTFSGDHDAALPTVVTLHRADTDEAMQRLTVAAGEAGVTLTAYDDTVPYYLTARQDDGHVARSANFTFAA